MGRFSKKKGDPQEGVDPETERGLEVEHEREDHDVDGGPESLAALRAERDDLRERWQRATADYQNLRRRSLAEAEERARRTLQPLLEKLLRVLDYLDMALASPATTDEAKNLAVGVKLTRDEFVQALEQEDVRVVPVGDRFDPALHEAKGAVVRADLAPGTVLDVLRPGYTWRGEILRYAQVIVSKTAEEEPLPASGAAAADEDEGS